MVGRDVRSARDRLLMKMTGRGLGAGATLLLREALDVDAFDNLFDRSWTSDLPILYIERMYADHLWTLVRANGCSEGFLFSPVEHGFAYSGRHLTRRDYDAILIARLRNSRRCAPKRCLIEGASDTRVAVPAYRRDPRLPSPMPEASFRKLAGMGRMLHHPEEATFVDAAQGGPVRREEVTV